VLGKCSTDDKDIAAFTQQWQEIMQDVDQNGDGQISLEEFTAAIEKTVLARTP
jgi:Ca2+-binding EF-hand superfamily protein